MKGHITAGQDSFLDIVANLVGILIILVVLVGAHASQQLREVRPDPEATETLASLQEQLEHDEDAARRVQLDRADIEQQILVENRAAASLTERRHQQMVALERIRLETESLRAQQAARWETLDQQQRELRQSRQAWQDRAAELKRKLATLEQERTAVESNVVAASATETIEHYPNPIARTVFTEEIHFRLAEGRLQYIPMEELIALMKSEWRVKAEKLKQASDTLETIGPIDGIRMQYELGAEMVVETGEFGQVRRRAIQFQRFQIVPQPGLQGETVADALRPGSRFRERVEQQVPDRTTVSIWLYPDGFADHAKLKTWLHEQGYRMASWPLEFGQPISGGPQGFKTSAQ